MASTVSEGRSPFYMLQCVQSAVCVRQQAVDSNFQCGTHSYTTRKTTFGTRICGQQQRQQTGLRTWTARCWCGCARTVSVVEVVHVVLAARVGNDPHERTQRERRARLCRRRCQRRAHLTREIGHGPLVPVVGVLRLQNTLNVNSEH